MATSGEGGGAPARGEDRGQGGEERAVEAARSSSESAAEAARQARASAHAAEALADPLVEAVVRREEAHEEAGADDANPFGRPGRPLPRRSPFVVGFTGALGVATAYVVVQGLAQARQVLVLLIVSMFLAVGLNPAVEALQRRGMNRGPAVGVVFLGALLFFAGFVAAVVPPLAAQTTAFVNNAPGYVSELQQNRTIERLDARFQLLERAQTYLQDGELATRAFGGLLGVGRVVLGTTFSTLTVLILTLYFLSSLPAVKSTAYRLAPRSRRARIGLLSDEILTRIGGYVAGALTIAGIAATTTFVFLSLLDVNYALPLAMLILVTDLIPLIGATLGAVAVTAVGFFHSPATGIACLIFYVIYQQVENYLIYPRVMKRSVDVPAAATIVAALVGGTLLGVVGALLAIPTAAAVQLLLEEVVIPRQDAS